MLRVIRWWSCGWRVDLRRRSYQRSGAGERPARREVLSSLRVFVVAAAWFPRQMGDHHSIDGVGLGSFAKSPREGTHLRWIDHTHGKASATRRAAPTASNPPVSSM